MMHKPTKVRAYMRRLSLVGEDPSSIFAGSGVECGDIETLRQLDGEVISDLFERIARQTPSSFAFECGRRAKISDLGLLGYRMLYCRTLREVFESWDRHFLIAHPPMASKFLINDERWELRHAPLLPLSAAGARFCMEAAITSFIKFGGELVDGPLAGLHFALPFSRPRDRREYEALDCAAITFDAPHFSIFGRTPDLDLLVSASDADTRALCESHCASMAARLAGPAKLSQGVEAILELGREIPPMAEVARRMGRQNNGCI